MRRGVGSSVAAAVVVVAALAGCGPATSDAGVAPRDDGSASPSVTPTDRGGLGGEPCGPFPPRHAYVQGVGTEGSTVWETEIRTGSEDNGSTLPALHVGGLVVVAQDDGVTALDETDGRVAWERRTGDSVYGLWSAGEIVAVLSDQVSTHARLTGLDASSGAVAWQTEIAGDGLFGDVQVTGDGGVAWMRADGTLQVVGLDDGAVRWSHSTGRSPALRTVAGAVLLGKDGAITAYDAGTGRVRWTARGLAPAPAFEVVDGLVLVTSSEWTDSTPTAMTALDPATGRVQWRFDPGSEVTILDGAGDAIAVATYVPKRRLFLLDRSTGKVRWDADTAVALDTHPLFVDDAMVTAEGGVSGYPHNTLVERDLGSGEPRWSVRLAGGPNGSRPLAAWNGRVLLVTPGEGSGRGSTLRGYDLADGTVAWETPMRTFVQAPLLVTGDLAIVHAADPTYACAL